MFDKIAFHAAENSQKEQTGPKKVCPAKVQHRFIFNRRQSLKRDGELIAEQLILSDAIKI